MQLNDLIEEQSIESIAKKTNVAVGVIIKLSHKEFKTMKMPQALGALSIIEREYGVDMGSLRQECKAYFAEHGLSDGGFVGIKPIKKEKRMVSKFLTLVLLAVLSYGAWYFFTEYYKQKINLLDSQSESALTETTLDAQDTLPKEVKEKIVAKSVSQDKPAAQPNTETNQSTEAAVAATLAGEENITAGAVETPQVAQSSESPQKVPEAIVRESITLIPQKSMWFRLTDLETKKQTEFKRNDKFEIDLKDHSWLFATENSSFSIIDNDTFEEFSDKGKLFFRFDQDGIHQLSEADYRAVEQ